MRNINSTHNYLYCEYVTGMVTYFDMKVSVFSTYMDKNGLNGSTKFPPSNLVVTSKETKKNPFEKLIFYISRDF